MCQQKDERMLIPPNLVAGMRWLQNTRTRRFNVRNQLWGSVFGDRYEAGQQGVCK
jgi:hypothetical protein